MGFWIFMLVMNLLVPLTMIGFGRKFERNAPKEINAVFGYRTTMSMKNKETWKFAHQYCGKLWNACGWGLLPLSVIAMLFVFGKDVDTVSIAGCVVCAVQIVVVIGTIFPVESALKRNFDKDGAKK